MLWLEDTLIPILLKIKLALTPIIEYSAKHLENLRKAFQETQEFDDLISHVDKLKEEVAELQKHVDKNNDEIIVVKRKLTRLNCLKDIMKTRSDSDQASFRSTLENTENEYKLGKKEERRLKQTKEHLETQRETIF